MHGPLKGQFVIFRGRCGESFPFPGLTTPCVLKPCDLALKKKKKAEKRTEWKWMAFQGQKKKCKQKPKMKQRSNEVEWLYDSAVVIIKTVLCSPWDSYHINLLIVNIFWTHSTVWTYSFTTDCNGLQYDCSSSAPRWQVLFESSSSKGFFLFCFLIRDPNLQPDFCKAALGEK